MADLDAMAVAMAALPLSFRPSHAPTKRHRRLAARGRRVWACAKPGAVSRAYWAGDTSRNLCRIIKRYHGPLLWPTSTPLRMLGTKPSSGGGVKWNVVVGREGEKP